MISLTKGIITIAIGKKYVQMAKYLAYSCMLNAPHILRAVITDNPELLNDFYDFILPYNCKDDPFSIKTRLYTFTPFYKTLYIDADSLIFHPIDEYFNSLDNYNYLYEGEKLTDGTWYFDIKNTCKIINTNWIPKFNSGMLLFKKNIETENIFSTAYYYFTNYNKENINITSFRGNNFPDEPAFAISLAKLNIEPIIDYGRFSRTLINSKYIQLNIKKKVTKIFKNGKTMNPLIIHFCGRKGSFYYIFEKIRLFFIFHFFNQ